MLLIVTIFVLSLIASGSSYNLSKTNNEDYPCESGFYCVYKFENGNVSLLEKHLIEEKEATDRIEKLILLAREKKKRIDEGKASFITTMGGCGSIPTDYCTITQNTVFEPGIYDLPHGISINANNVTLDCNGAVLKGAADQGVGESGIDIFKSNVEVRNCVIQNFGNGMFVLGNNNKFINNDISGNLDSGIIFVDAVSNNITGNIFHSNKNGVNINGNSKNILLTENIFYDNERGVYISPPSQDTKLLGNNICKSSYLDIFLTNSTAKHYGNENSCDKPGEIIWFWNDVGTVGCSYTCSEEICDKLEPALKKGFRLLNYTDNNWRVDFLGWVKDSKHSEYNLCYPYNFNMNISYESFVEYELNVSVGKDKLRIAYTYLLSGGQENSVYFSTKVFIYNFGRGVWEGVYDKPRNGGVSTEDVVDIYLSKERIQNGKIRLRAVQKNIDVNESAGSCSVVFLGGEQWSGTISLDRFTHQFCSSHCSNGIRDGDETDIDCGGSCNPCVSCSNGMQDGDETGIDCGGSCPVVCGDCKPYIINGNHEDKIDVVFIPDISYNGDTKLFEEHIGLIINNSYKKSAPINDNLNKFNFYYIEEQSWTNWTTWTHHLPKKFKTECSFYDVAAIIHTDKHRDFASDKEFSSEYYSNGTIIHESGHALFGLADEYCCDSHYHKPKPFPNIYPNETDCRQDAINESWNPNNCNLFCDPNQNTGNRINNCGDGWWRSDPDPDIMDTSSKVEPFQRADLRNVYWTFDQYPNATIIAMASEPIEDKKVIIFDLYFENTAINLTDIKIIYNDAPEYITKSGDINIRLMKDNNTIKDIKIWDPRIVTTEEESVCLDTGNVSIHLQVKLDEDLVGIYSNNSLTLSINLKEYFKSFCSFQDGKCDKDCLDNIGFDVDCFSIKLNKGWNLISFPLILTNNSIAYMLNNTNYTKIFYYDGKYKELLKNETINEKYGLWINVLNDSIFKISGKSFINKTYNISEGWNLIGYPYLEEKNISNILNNTNITLVYTYNGSWLSYVPNRTFNSLQTLKPGYGYWVKK